MVKITKGVFGFIGFLLSVWIGRGAHAGFVVDENLSGATNHKKQFDMARFARTGDVIRAHKSANLFAYACIGYASVDPTDYSANRLYHTDSTYFYCCGTYTM